MADISITINATAAPIQLGTITVSAPISIGTIGLRLPGVKGDKGDMGSISPATASVLGGIKVGSNLAIADGVLSIDTAALTAYVDTVILGGAS